MKFSSLAVLAARASTVLAVALLAACGGGGGGGGSSPPPAVAEATVFAGLLQGAGSRDATGVAAQFNQPGGVVESGAGTIYVADTGNHTIRRITQQGVVTTLAGTAGQAGAADGTGAAARFSSPVGLALDGANNLYVADSGNRSVRRISASGAVTTLANLPDAPLKLALDAAGGIYVLSAQAIRRLAADGSVTTLPVQSGAAGSQAFGLALSGIAVDAAGNLYVAEAAPSGFATGVGTVRKLDPQGRALPFGPAADGLVRIAFPVDIAIDGAGKLLVANSGRQSFTPRISFNFATVVRVEPDGTQTVVAGADEDGRTVDGPATLARFDSPRAIAAGPGGQVVVVETSRNAVRLVDAQGTVSSLAGGNGAGEVDGAGAQARFDGPEGIAAAPDGSLFVVERTGGAVRRISPAGAVTTWAPATPSALDRRLSVAVNRAGAVLVGYTGFATFVRSVYTVAAGGSLTFVANATSDGSSTAIAIDAAGNLILAEPDGIKAVASDGSKRVLAPGVNAVALAADASGAVYYATLDGTVGAVYASGQVAVLAGVAGQAGDQDGTGATARFRRPTALATGAAGNVFVADGLRIRRVGADGAVVTIADLSTLDGVQPASIAGLAWANGALFATVKNAVVRIAPVN